MGRHSGNAVGDLTRLLRWGTATGDNDDRLLERFLADGDESAFAGLVARHGPMVLGVCRRVLRDGHDVEDAFQATFLILARNARTIRRSERVGPWLHGVARRVAVRARSNAARRLVRERIGIDAEPSGDASSSRDPERVELREILDEELNGLPERLRAPLVLCYLEGLTHDQAASRLSQPVGTIRSRLSRGRERLRVRLVRRGVRADDVVLGSAAALESVSPALLETTVRSALEFAASQTGASALASAGSIALAKGVLDAMMISKLTLTAACALGLVLTAGGLSGYAFQQDPGTEQAEPEAANDAPKDDSNAFSAMRSRLDKIDRVLADLDRRRGEENKMILSAHEQLSELRSQLERAAKSAEPEAAQPPDRPATAASDENRPRYHDPMQPIVIPSEDGHVVTVFVISGGGRLGEGLAGERTEEETPTFSVRLAEAGSPPLKVLLRTHPRMSGPVALELRGKGIRRIATFRVMGRGGRKLGDSVVWDRGWSVQELREPVAEAQPVFSTFNGGTVAYVLGRWIYVYSFMVDRWSVLELPEGARPEPPKEDFTGLVLEYEGIVYSYTGLAGDGWSKFDTRNVPEEEKSEE